MNFLIKKHKKMKKNSSKGFTLVEVIVVIVIIAILAGIAVPALTGYIEKAKDKAAILEAKNITSALQTISVESYATGARIYGGAQVMAKVRIGGAFNSTAVYSDKTYLETINELIGSNYTKDNFGDARGDDRQFIFSAGGTNDQGRQGVIDKFIFITNEGIEITYDKGKYTRTK